MPLIGREKVWGFSCTVSNLISSFSWYLSDQWNGENESSIRWRFSSWLSTFWHGSSLQKRRVSWSSVQEIASKVQSEERRYFHHDKDWFVGKKKSLVKVETFNFLSQFHRLITRQTPTIQNYFEGHWLIFEQTTSICSLFTGQVGFFIFVNSQGHRLKSSVSDTGATGVPNNSPNLITYRHSAWDALVKFQKAGYIRSIGVSNFLVKHLDDLKKISGVVPAVNQVEWHPQLHDVSSLETYSFIKLINYVSGQPSLLLPTKQHSASSLFISWQFIQNFSTRGPNRCFNCQKAQ